MFVLGQVSPAYCRPLNLRVEDLDSGFLSERRDAIVDIVYFFFLLSFLPFPSTGDVTCKMYPTLPPKNAFTMPRSVL